MYENTLIQTLTIDRKPESMPYYEISPFGSHTLVRSRRVTKATGWGRLPVALIPWGSDDALNRAVIRTYMRVSKDMDNRIDHVAALSYFRAYPEVLGNGRPQIICEPKRAEQLAQNWDFLSPTIYAVEHMAIHGNKSVFYLLLPSPEVLGIAPIQGDKCGIFIRESRRVVAARF